MDAEFWYRNLRQTVQFAPAIRAMAQAGIDTLIEISPHPVLTAPALETMEAELGATGAAAISSLRRDHGGLDRFVASLAEAHTGGVAVDWQPMFAGADQVRLPTYAFQHRRYWLSAGDGARDPGSIGQRSAEHPLLDAVVSLAGGQGTVFTGRLSVDRHPWLADHVVVGHITLPPAAFLELALHAGAHTGAEVVEALTLGAPLVFDDEQAVAIQVTVSEPGEDGRRQVAIHSRTDNSDSDWTEHATGTLTADDQAALPPVAPWPAAGEEIGIDAFYDRLEQAGYVHGAAFQGVRTVAVRRDEILAEIELADDEAQQGASFLLHPALLDAALQPAILLATERRAGATVAVDAWSDVQLHGLRASAVSARVRLDDDGGAAHVTLSDGTGNPVASMRATLSAARQIAGARRVVARDALLRLAWHEAAIPGANGARYALLGGSDDLAANVDIHPDLGSVAASIDPAQPTVAAVLADFREPPGQPAAAAARSVLGRALDLIQAWLAEKRLSTSRLVFVTQGAIAAVEGDGVPALAVAPLWGLVRSAQSEHPDRFVLVDIDRSDASLTSLHLAIAAGEPQLALRDGRMLVPRLGRIAETATAPDLERAAAGTVLITGGTGGIGALLARHLVAGHGVDQLLLTSRRGRRAPGALELEEELSALGASVRIETCDMSDRAQVEALLRSMPPDHPLTGVVHAAGHADNSLVASMTAEQIDQALAPKLDAALNLHELTRDSDLDLFLLCSSMAATFGGPGQGNYAAANAFLDALAEERRACGLAGTSVEWGIWEGVGKARTLEGSLEQLLRQMSGSSGFRPFSAELGLELFDGALAAALPTVLAAPYRLDVIREEVSSATGSRLMAGLVRSRSLRVAANGRGSLKQRLSRADDEDRRRIVVDETRAQIATALGYASPESLQMDLSFLELGFDSLVGLELRKRLQSVTGLSLPATMISDHPTPAALVEYLQGLVNGTGDGHSSSTPPSDSGAGNGQPGPSTLTTMFRRAHQLGKTRDGIAVAEAAARLRPKFGLSHTDAQAPTVVPLARGEQEPILFCFPSLVAIAGPHEYARFAKAFQGRRDVVTVPAPGFGPGELLPSTLEAAVVAQATAIRRHADGRNVAFVGYSTGGVLAHAVANECAREGLAPTAVVLIDSYTMDAVWRVSDPVFDRMLASEGSHPAVSDETLTAMGAYLGMLSSWTPGKAVAPTLLVRAGDPMTGVDRNGDWQATWPQCHTTVDVPGTHLTILEERADTTARMVEEWLVHQSGSSQTRERLGWLRPRALVRR
jgi:acyl transferase domain-containing protein/thioesterase domain-containing protein